MASQEPKKVPQNLQLAVNLSCGLTIAASVVYVVLSIIALVFRQTCDEGEVGMAPVDLFIWGLVRVYIQADSCDAYDTPAGVTAADTVFILVLLILVTSVLSAIAAGVFISLVKIEHDLLQAAGYVYMATFVCTLIVDLTLGVLFGMDYTFLSQQMHTVTTIESSYPIDVLRLGALFLMTIVLKGYVLHAINIILIILIIIYFQQYKNILNKNEHPIHNLGILDAYDQPKKEWEQRRDMYNSTFAAGPQRNPGFIDDDYTSDRNLSRDQRNDFQPSRAYEHSDSWHHTGSNQSNIGSNRPFTYLEEPPRTPKAPSPAVEPPWRTHKTPSPAVEPPWRGNWSNPPPVPAPDYSPQPRRLKSAMKPGYI